MEPICDVDIAIQSQSWLRGLLESRIDPRVSDILAMLIQIRPGRIKIRPGWYSFCTSFRNKSAQGGN